MAFHWITHITKSFKTIIVRTKSSWPGNVAFYAETKQQKTQSVWKHLWNDTCAISKIQGFFKRNARGSTWAMQVISIFHNLAPRSLLLNSIIMSIYDSMLNEWIKLFRVCLVFTFNFHNRGSNIVHTVLSLHCIISVQIYLFYNDFITKQFYGGSQPHTDPTQSQWCYSHTSRSIRSRQRK